MGWGHAQCESCWHEANPDRAPVRVIPEHLDPRACCSCGKPTLSGIFVRAAEESMDHPAGCGYEQPPSGGTREEVEET